MTVVHTVASLRAEHGGPSRSVTALASALAHDGTPSQILTLRTPGEGAPIRPDPAVSVSFVPRPRYDARLFLPGHAFERALDEVLRRGSTVLHDHGVWLPSNHVSARVAHRTGAPRVVSVRGMLSAWALAQGAAKKRLAWRLYQHRDLETAVVVHVTSEQEAEEVRRAGVRAPLAVIPNGVPLPEPLPRDNRRPPRALFMGRVHPKKGLSLLLRVWPSETPWELVVVGPDEGGHRAELEALARARGIDRTVRFVDEVDDTAKWTFYHEADLFVLPSHSENFGIVVAEALAAGVPVLTTQGTPWRELERERCGWWVPVEEEALRTALTEALRLPRPALEAMGARGRALVERRYGWPHVAAQMREVYAWSLSRRTRPDTVHV